VKIQSQARKYPLFASALLCGFRTIYCSTNIENGAENSQATVDEPDGGSLLGNSCPRKLMYFCCSFIARNSLHAQNDQSRTSNSQHMRAIPGNKGTRVEKRPRESMPYLLLRGIESWLSLAISSPICRTHVFHE
jgi:hypothetical protein